MAKQIAQDKELQAQMEKEREKGREELHERRQVSRLPCACSLHCDSGVHA